MLGKFAMMNAQQRMAINRETARQKQMMAVLAKMFQEGQPAPASASSAQPSAFAGVVPQMAGAEADPSMAGVSVGGAVPASFDPASANRGMAGPAPAAMPPSEVATPALPSLWADRDLQKIIAGNVAAGNFKGAMDAAEQARKQRQDLLQAGPKRFVEKQAELKAQQPQARQNVSNLVSDLDRMKAEAQAILNDDYLGQATGARIGLDYLPGTGARDVSARIGTLKSQSGFAVLQAMREASKTGGALGSVTEGEHKLLQANLAAIGDTGQSTGAYRKRLQQVVDYVESAKARILRGYSDTYGETFAPATGGGQPRSDPFGLR
jgi:hypothetical protein